MELEDITTISLLLKNDSVDIEKSVDNALPPLLLALNQGAQVSYEVIQLLLDAGVDVRTKKRLNRKSYSVKAFIKELEQMAEDSLSTSAIIELIKKLKTL